MLTRWIKYIFLLFLSSVVFAKSVPEELKPLIVSGGHHVEFGRVNPRANVLTYDLGDYTGPPAPYAGMVVFIFIGTPTIENRQYQTLLEREIALRQKEPAKNDDKHHLKVSITPFNKQNYTGTLVKSIRFSRNKLQKLSDDNSWRWDATLSGYYLKSRNVFIYVFVSEVAKRTQIDPENVIDTIIHKINNINLEKHIPHEMNVSDNTVSYPHFMKSIQYFFNA